MFNLINLLNTTKGAWGNALNGATVADIMKLHKFIRKELREQTEFFRKQRGLGFDGKSHISHDAHFGKSLPAKGSTHSSGRFLDTL